MKKLHWLYILLHMVFWCDYAVVWSYATVFLQSAGYNSTIIGVVTGTGAILSVLGQPILASATRKLTILNNRRNIAILKVVSIVVATVVMLKLPGFYTVAVLFLILLAIDASIPSILSTVAMDCINEGKEINYGLARGSGSIAFAIFSLILGYSVNNNSTDILMILYIIFGIIMVMVEFMFEYTYNSMKKHENQKDSEAFLPTGKLPEENTKFVKLFKKYRFLICFLIGSIFFFMGHYMVNTFLINIMECVGGNSSNLGVALAIAATVELPVMALFVKLEKRFPISRLLVISGIFFTVKCLVVWMAPNITVVYISQFLQFGAFALYTPASVYYINNTMERCDGPIGQSLLGACTLGLGGTFGNLLGGVILEKLGVHEMILISAVISLMGCIFMVASNSILKKSKKAI